MSTESLFGTPLVIEPMTRDAWIAILFRDWTTQMGRQPGPLVDDLENLASLFGAGASPKAIRDRVHVLPPADDHSHDLPRAASLLIDGCAVVTPEGRIMLDVLLQLQQTASSRIDTGQQVWALSMAAGLRAHWHTTWLRKQFEGSLSASALAAALFLLVNGSVGEPRGLLLPADVNRDRELGAVILPLLAKFSHTLGGREPDLAGGIRQHWAFTQVSRLLGRQVDRKPVPDGTLTYIRVGQDQTLLDELARRLDRADPHRRGVAVRELLEGYRRVRGVLAAYGLMHEDPTASRRILDRLANQAQ